MIAEASVRLGVFATVVGEVPVRFETSLEGGDCEQAWFLASAPVRLGALVKLETEDTLWMGVVATCHKEGEEWRVAFHVEHILRNVQDLLYMAARFE